MAPAICRARARGVLLLSASLAAASCTALAGGREGGRRELDELSARERVDLLRRAAIWRPVDTAALDLLAGPAVPGARPFDALLACDWVRPDGPPSGGTPKFHCDLGDGDVVKVKFGKDNGEVYGEVLATRLAWALGFAADAVYPVQISCRGCPMSPWYFPTEARVAEKHFELATLERKLPGKKISTDDFEGWSWDEIDRVDESAGGASAAHRDALKLFAAFIQHSDNKPSQQRLFCPQEAFVRDAAGNESCSAPLLYLQDLGATFGASTFLNSSKAELARWAAVPVWKDEAACVAHLANSWTGNLTHPRVGEEGRRFLAERLALLTDEQLRDLFTAARVERRGATVRGAGGERPETVADWVEAFKRKRDDLARARCPA